MKNRAGIVQLFIANSISGIAQGISMIAIPWYFAKQGEMTRFAFIYMLASIISLFWVPYSGTLIDKFNRKHIFLTITTVCGTFLACIAGAGLFTAMDSWLLVAAVFILTFANYNIHYPNLYAFMQEITEQKHYGKITSYLEITGQLSNVLAGAGAALLLEGTQNGFLNIFGFKIAMGLDIQAWSIYEIFMLDASTYVAAFFIILAIKYQPLVVKKAENSQLIDQLKTGWHYLKTHPDIFLFGVASYSIFVAVLLTTFYLNATYVSDHLKEGGDVFAASEMYFAVGALFAGIAIRKIFSWTTIPMSITILTFLTTGIFFLLFYSNSLFTFYAMCLLLGLANAGTRIMRITYLFTHVPNQVYGRASSIFFLTNIAFRIMLLGIFSFSFFHIDNHVIFAFLILAVFLGLTGVVLVRNYQRFIKQEA